ncbi:MAG: molybdopterin-dependent oxidoreductase [Deltaproteobacteria bacterium]|nr:molybdopterin-dependent oxidoreductase [Deltaproteobacteria bacterium]
MDEPRRTFSYCGLCDACCGVVVDHDGARVRSIRGDPDDPLSRGHVCPKVVAHADLQEDPDRLRRPLRRRGNDWEEISWADALDEVGAGLARVTRECGSDAVGVVFGNPAGHHAATLLALPFFASVLGTHNVFSANSTDAWPRMLASLLVYGNQALLPVPDIDRTRFLLVLGANPAVSNGSLLTAPDCGRRIADIRRRGGRVVVVDPRRTETAALADRHLFIRPETDVLLLLALLHVVLGEGPVCPGALAGLLDGEEELRAIAQAYPPERVAALVGIEAATIAGLAREFRGASPAVCYGRMGTTTQSFGTSASWLIDALNLVTGNTDREGGAMFARPVVDLAGLAERLGRRGSSGRRPSRATGLPDLDGEQPLAALAAEMETPGPGRIRALLTVAANPVLSRPGGTRLDHALAGLDFMAAIDLYVNETTRHAHVILPALAPLECDRLPVLEYAYAVRHAARHAPPVLRADPQAREDWRILLDILSAAGRRRGGLRGAAWRASAAAACAIGPNRVLDLLLRTGPHRLSLAKLDAAPHGLDLGPLQPRLAAHLKEAGRRAQLAPEPCRRDLERVERFLADDVRRAAGELRLVSRRTMRGMNTWLANCRRLAPARDSCTLQIHPLDAKARGLTDEGRAEVSSEAGTIEVAVELTDGMMPGTVSLPFGWGHGRHGARAGLASRHPGASINDVIADDRVDTLSGTSAFEGAPVRVRPVGAAAPAVPPVKGRCS